MTDEVSILAAQAEAMVAQLRRFESDRVGATLDRGHAVARGLVKQAFVDARAAVRKAVQRARRRRDAATLKAQAQSETRARLAVQSRLAQLLTRGWERLPFVLQLRWQDAEGRQRWSQGAVAEARLRLLGEHFTVEHAPGLSAAEQAALRAACGDREMVFVQVDELAAGLRIRTPGATLDASLTSLLADRERVDSQLLAIYQDLPEVEGRSHA
jgi:hypothetical protein